MGASWLHRCLGLFEETVEARHGWRPDYSGLERALEPVRFRRRSLSYRDIETIQNGRFWDFRQFWRFPPESDIAREADFEEMTRLVQGLPLDEALTIARLHEVFKYIENVSVVLRFIHPEHYGILSPPVEKVLEVRRGRTEVETYLNYLRDIRDLRDHHGLSRAADADMALWVVQERVLSSYRDCDLLAEFRADTWLTRRRAVNLLAGLGELAGTQHILELARALAGAHAGLAGLLAGCELERRLRAEVGDSARELGLEAAIARLALRGDAGRAEAWRRAARIRDLCVAAAGHGSGPTRRDVAELIEEVERLGEPSSA